METVMTILSMLGGFIALGTYLHADVQRVDERVARVEERVGRLETRVEKLDDRVYSLATGLKPLIDDLSRAEST